TPNNANEQVNIDDFQITDFGTEQTAMPVTSIGTGIYESKKTVTIASETSGATIYYTTDGTKPTTTSAIYSNSNPLDISTTTKIRAIAVAVGKVDSREEVVLISFPELVDNLAALYTKMATTGTNLTYFKYTGEAIVTASYTATYKTLFLQDITAGIIISDTYRNTSSSYNIGDKLTGIICQINRINDSPQLYPYAEYTVVSTGNKITPPLVTLTDVPNRTNQLVQINDLYFDISNGTEKFTQNASYVIHDSSIATTTITFRTANGMPNPDYINSIIPAKRNIICLVAKNSPIISTHHIFARNAAELDVQVSALNDLKINDLFVSNNKVYFETLSVEKVNVYSVNGQLIKSNKSSIGKNSIELKNGVYLIKIGEKTAKVVL
ncbi:MAG: chitobiase/beta-hexosaminidase C-terminal domain-containing protein, partial [Paludibacter sp.]